MTATLIFWSAVALTFYAWAGYPLLLLALASMTNRTVAKKRVTPPVTFIITAYNEEERVRAKIENTLAQDYPASRFEVIVASDCSTDRTDDIAREYGGVRLVRAGERRGKEAAQQLALDAASGEIVVFSDVATALAPTAVSSIITNFADPTVGCVSSIDRFVDADGRVTGEGAYVRYEMWLRRLETRVYSVVGLSGSFFAARRDVCRAWSADRQSDFSTALHAVDLGLRAVLDPETAGYYRNITDDRPGGPGAEQTHAESVPLRTVRVGARQPQAVPLARADGDDRGGRGQPVSAVRFAGIRGSVRRANRVLCGGRARSLDRRARAAYPLVPGAVPRGHPDRLVPLRVRRADDVLDAVAAAGDPAADRPALMVLRGVSC